MIIDVPQLSEHHFKNAKFYKDRGEMLSLLPSNSIGAEVGVFKGDFSKIILKKVNPLRLVLIDIQFQIDIKKLFADDVNSGRVIIMEEDSVSSLEKFEDEYFDWLYIDGDHSMDGVKRDVDIAKKKITSNGVIILNDYKMGDHNCPGGFFPYGVIHAANNLCIEDGFEMIGFAFHHQMYCDVALRRV